MAMKDYKLLIVADIQRAIEGINNMAVSLQHDIPPSSGTLPPSYREATIHEFRGSSQPVVESLLSASTTTSSWLEQMGDKLSRNLDEVARIQGTRNSCGTSIGLKEAHERSRATDAHIRTLEDDIQRKESNLASLEEVMNHARNDLAHHENTRNSMRIAAMATFFFPIVPAVLMAVDATSMRVAIEERQRTVCTIEGRLRTLSSQLDSRRTQLAGARAERDRVSSLVSQLERRVDDLAAETRQLEAERETLAYLPARINDCLHALALAGNSRLTGSKAISTRNVILGIKGVVEALASEEMLAGPLKQLNDTIQNLKVEINV